MTSCPAWRLRWCASHMVSRFITSCRSLSTFPSISASSLAFGSPFSAHVGTTADGLSAAWHSAATSSSSVNRCPRSRAGRQCHPDRRQPLQRLGHPQSIDRHPRAVPQHPLDILDQGRAAEPLVHLASMGSQQPRRLLDGIRPTSRTGRASPRPRQVREPASAHPTPCAPATDRSPACRSRSGRGSSAWRCGRGTPSGTGAAPCPPCDQARAARPHRVAAPPRWPAR